MSEEKPASIWSYRIPKKKPTGDDADNSTTTKSGLKRKPDNITNSVGNDKRIKVEDTLNSDDEEYDATLAHVFGVGSEKEASLRQSRMLLKQRDARKDFQKSRAIKAENNEEERSKIKIRSIKIPKSILTRSEGIELEKVKSAVDKLLKEFPKGIKRDALLQEIRKHISNEASVQVSFRKQQTLIEGLVQKLRQLVQRLPYIAADAVFIRSKGILNAVSELVFNGENLGIPIDIVLDAKSIRTKWIREDFDVTLMRGIENKIKMSRHEQKGRTKRKMHWHFEEGYQHKIGALVPGHNGLNNGDWWPLQICALRDGAHGETEAGISGSKEYGCVSVVVSSGYICDEDEGDTVYYCGTVGIKDKTGICSPSAGTKLLQLSQTNETPIRLLRSSKVKSIYAPKKGIRYDGLYLVEGYEVIDEVNQMYRFTLKRMSGQPPIRYEGPGARPNPFDLNELDKIKDLLKGER